MTAEHSRLGLYNRLGEVLGEAHAKTMMDTFANLTTKEDLTRVDDRFDRIEDRFDRLEYQFHQLGSEIRGFYKTILVTMVASMAALTGIFAALLAAFR